MHPSDNKSSLRSCGESPHVPPSRNTYQSSSSSTSTERYINRVPTNNSPIQDAAGKHDDWYQESLNRMEQRRRQFEEEVRIKRDEFFRSSSLFPRHENCVLDAPSLSSHSRLGSEKLCDSSPTSFSEVISPMRPGGALVPLLSSNQFERDENGQLMFRLKFDVSDFDVDNIRVTTKEDRLTVTAKKDVKSSNSANTKEFTHTMDLPKGVNAEEIACKLTDEGVLVLSAPISDHALLSVTSPGRLRNTPSPNPPPDIHYKSGSLPVYHRNSSDLGSSVDRLSASSLPIKTIHVRPSMGSTVSSISESGSIVSHPDGHREFRLCVNLGDDYQPHEVSVKTTEQKLYVHAKHEEKSAHRTVLREFTKDFDIPLNVDPQSITAKFKQGTLILSAPVYSASNVSFI